MSTIKVLGSGCANCRRLTALTEQALAELGLAAERREGHRLRADRRLRRHPPRLNRPVGADRKRARWNQRGVNVALVIVIVAFIEIGNRVGGDGAGLVLGAVAGVASLFICVTLTEFVRTRP